MEILLQMTQRSKGRTIRKVMGGGGRNFFVMLAILFGWSGCACIFFYGFDALQDFFTFAMFAICCFKYENPNLKKIKVLNFAFGGICGRQNLYQMLGESGGIPLQEIF